MNAYVAGLIKAGWGGRSGWLGGRAGGWGGGSRAAVLSNHSLLFSETILLPSPSIPQVGHWEEALAAFKGMLGPGSPARPTASTFNAIMAVRWLPLDWLAGCACLCPCCLRVAGLRKPGMSSCSARHTPSPAAAHYPTLPSSLWLHCRCI